MKSWSRAVCTLATALSSGLLSGVGCKKPAPSSFVAIEDAAPSSSPSALPSIACDHPCRLRVLAPLRRGDTYAAAVDGKHVFLATAQAASVSRISIEGGSKTVLAPAVPTKDLRRPAQLALSETDVYWALDSRIFKIPKTGGDPVQVSLVENRIVNDLTYDAGALWWTTFTDPSKEFTSLDWRVHTLASAGVASLGKPLNELSLQRRVDATSAMFLDDQAHVLFEVPHAKGTRIVLARALSGEAKLVAHDEKSVYVLEGRALASFSRGEKSVRTSLASLPADATVQSGIVDANDVWLECTHALLRVPKLGGTPVIHEDWAPNFAGSTRPAIDATAIYLDLRTAVGATATHVLVRIPK